MATMEVSQMISLEAAAQRLGIGRTMVFRLAREGRFPARAIKIGAVWRVSVPSIERLLDDDPVPYEMTEPTEPTPHEGTLAGA